MSRLLSGLIDLVAPRNCTLCGSRIEAIRPTVDGIESLCAACSARVPRRMPDACQTCGMPQGPHVGPVRRCGDCPTTMGPIQQTVALFRYDGDPLPTPGVDDSDRPAEPIESDRERWLQERMYARVRDAILRLKFGGASELGDTLGRALGRLVATYEFAGELDAVVPVPLHWRRMLRRRYNQAERIAAGVGRALDVPCAHLVRRRAATEPQTHLNKEARARNVRHAFAMVGPVRRWWAGASDLPGARILLVDDVMTTGATIVACARVLKEAGAASIHAAVVGRR